MKPIVANLHNSFFMSSETFIYNYISNLKSFHPICLASEFLNLEEFAFPKEDIYKISYNRRKYSFKRISNRFFMRDIRAEKAIKERKPKLIHAHFGWNGYYALRIARRAKIPLVTSFYGCDMSAVPKRKKWLARFRILFNEGDLFLVEGDFMKSNLLDLGCLEEKISIQRIAIPLDKIRFMPRKPKRRGDKMIMIFCGRFVEKKGLNYALEAIEMVKNKHDNFEFRIIGDGPLKPNIENFIKIHRLDDNVKMLGFLTFRNYLDEMQKADIYIHPSITASDGDSEGGAPTTILEAQAMGMPIISTIHADIPNIVLPGKSALLSKEKDSFTLAQNIAYLLENQEVWESMGQKGREFVENYHDIKKEVVNLEEKYMAISKC
jgi:colanic acid/amylovoran biosynthesis glycosyltransferase